eukprot:Rmarinus@m.28490
MARRALRVSSAPIWAEYCPAGIHKTDASGCGVSSPAGSEVPDISGRYTSGGQGSTAGQESDAIDGPVAEGSGVCDQRGEVSIVTESADDVFGHGDRHSEHDVFSSQRQDEGSTTASSQDEDSSSNGSADPATAGFADGGGGVYSDGSVSSSSVLTTTSDGFTIGFTSGDAGLGREDVSVARGSGRAPVVAGQSSEVQREKVRRARDDSDTIHRRKRQRLG